MRRIENNGWMDPFELNLLTSLMAVNKQEAVAVCFILIAAYYRVAPCRVVTVCLFLIAAYYRVAPCRVAPQICPFTESSSLALMAIVALPEVCVTSDVSSWLF